MRCLVAWGLCLLLLGGPADGWAHSRTRREPPSLPALPVPRPPLAAPALPAPPPPPPAEEALRHYSLAPAPDPVMLLQAARRARQVGEIDKARWLYRLLMRLQPESELAAAARQEKLVLEFYLDLAHEPPLKACRRFFGQAATLPGTAPSAPVRQALREGWRAVARALAPESPLPPPVAEEVLALGELHPPGAWPPEAQLLLSRLLRERGLTGEARQLLEQVLAVGEEPLRLEAAVHLLELAWSEQGLGGFLSALARLETTHSLAVAALQTRTVTLEGAPAADRKAPPPTLPLPPARRLALWEALAGQSLPGPLVLYLLKDLAEMAQTGEHRARVLYQTVLEGAREELGPGYYFDRVGLQHLRQGQWLAAQEAFQAQTQDSDPFWQHLGRVRLQEVELARLQGDSPR